MRAFAWGGGLIAILGILSAAVLYNEKKAAFPPGSPPLISPSSTRSMEPSLSLASSAFADGASISARYGCDGAGESPPLAISGIPEGARSLALIAEDPDVPRALKADGVFDHWVLFNIPPETREIPAGASPGTAGKNSAGKNAYAAPCPPPQYEPSEHRYAFALYALDALLPLGEGASKADVLAAMEGHVLAQSVLIGRYKRQ